MVSPTNLLRALFGRKSRRQTARRGNQPTPSARRTTGAGRTVTLAIQIETGAILYWQISPDHIARVDEPSPHTTIISFTNQDFRIKSNGPVSVEQAKSLAVRESLAPEKMRVVNQSRKAGVIYATPVSRLTESPFMIAPGLQVLDRLLQRQDAIPPLVAGFYFTAEGCEDSVAILHALRENGSHLMLVSINPDNLESICQMFMASARMPPDSDAQLYSLDDFLSAVSPVLTYPAEPEWQGIPLSRIWLGGSALAAGAAALGVTYAAYTLARIDNARRDLLVVQGQIRAEQNQIGQRINQRPLAFGLAASINDSHLFRTAEWLWSDGTTVAIKADSNGTEYAVTLPLISGRSAPNNRPSVFGVAQPHQLQHLVAMAPPQGCVKKDILSTGNLNEIQVTFYCAALNPYVSALGGL